MKLVLIVVIALIELSYTFLQDSKRSEFAGKVVLVTGGTTGIGFATALAFAKEGAQVIIAARDSHPECYSGITAVEAINSNSEVIIAGGNSAKFFKADIRNVTQVKQLILFIEQNYISLDIAVNNAGIGGYGGNIEDIPDEVLFSEHDPILNNLYGVFNTLKEEIKHFKKMNKTGSIVNLSSYNGLRSCPGCSMYSASKYGIIGLTKSVALENLNNPYIRVNAVAPGLVDTFLTRNQVNGIVNPGRQSWEGKCITKEDELWLKFKREFTKVTLAGRLLEPEEIAEVILFLSSRKSSAMTGNVLPGDIGETSK